jgi:POT family proton-dependent oligopeptide transporter
MPSSSDTSFFGHPRGLSTLFFTELWERFGYYGMRALLVLFMTATVASGGLGMEDSTAYAIYGLYTAGVYMSSLPGGWIADRLIGQRRAVLYGGILIALGYLMLAAPNRGIFFCGLFVVVLGTGMLKPNISTIVGQLYDPVDPRRDAGFSIFYMGINIGATVAPLICGYVGQRINWHYGFALSGLGMIFGIIQFLVGRKRLGEAGLHPVQPAASADGMLWRRQFRNGSLALVGLLALLAFVHFSGIFALDVKTLVNAASFILLGIVITLFGWMFLAADWTPEERKRLIAIAVLFFASVLFWSAFEQAGSSLSLFGKRNSNNFLFGFEFPASWYLSLNSLFIVTLAPVFAWIWMRLGRHQPSSPAKFALGLITIGLGFIVMMVAALKSAGGDKVSPLWLTATYCFHTVGELLLSPVGLSAFAKLAPVRVAGFMMGVWFLSIATGNFIGGRLAAFYGNLPMHDLFRTVAMFSIIAGVGLALASKPVSRLMGGVK